MNITISTLFPSLQKMVLILYKSVVIDGATHVFVEEGAEQKSFKETLKWLQSEWLVAF